MVHGKVKDRNQGAAMRGGPGMIVVAYVGKYVPLLFLRRSVEVKAEYMGLCRSLTIRFFPSVPVLSEQVIQPMKGSGAMITV